MPPSTEGPAGGALLRRLLGALDEELPAATALRERLHARPELANAEHETAKTVLAELGGDGARRVAGTGILARVGPPGPGEIAVRAELDALAVGERTGAPFAATGEAMHACGHDVHMAALVALFRAARRIEGALPAPLLAVFQPSEEDYPSGAVQLLDAGALEGVAAIAAAHVHPGVPAGAVTADDGPVNASSDNFCIEVGGRAGHAAYPHTARDPVVVLAEIVVALQTLVSRTLDPLHGAVVSVTRLDAGTAENVIPARACARGTIRSLDPADRVALKERMRDLVEHLAAGHGCTSRLALTEGEPAIVNDPELTARVRPLLRAAGAAPSPPMRSCGSDDFGFFGSAARLLLLFVGFDPAPGVPRVPLHHPEFLPGAAAVGAVARAQAAAYVAAARA